MNNSRRPTALITGASRGLGAALTEALASKGWRIIMTARDVDALQATRDSIGEAHPEAALLAVAGDITEAAHREALANQVASLDAPLDLLVNNAGTLGPSPLPELLTLDLAAFATVLHTNTVSQLGMIQALAPHFATHPTIINLSSDAASNAYPTWGAYGASKIALEHVGSVLASEREAWRVLNVDPGDMRTTMHQDAFPGEDISDRPEPAASVPGLLRLIEESSFSSGRYLARMV